MSNSMEHYKYDTDVAGRKWQRSEQFHKNYTRFISHEKVYIVAVMLWNQRFHIIFSNFV